MRLVSLHAKDFGCVKEADVRFGPGLNVLFGPNDLGKSSLAEAIRFALLLQHGSSYSESIAPWRSDATPLVELVFQTEPQRYWRVRKTFGSGSRGSSVFEFSKDGTSFMVEAKARKVDAEIRKHLRWGIPEPGGRGGPRGMPESFLTTVLLARQDGVTELFERSLGKDPDESGRKLLAEALQAATQDPQFAKVLGKTQAKVDEAFTATGRYRKGRNDPFTQIKDRLDKAEQDYKDLDSRVLDSESSRDRVRQLTEQLVFEEQERDLAKTAWEQIQAIMAKTRELEKARAELTRIEGLRQAAIDAREVQQTAATEVEKLQDTLEAARTDVGTAESRVAETKAEVARLQTGEEAQARLARQRGLEKEIAEAKTELGRLQSQVERARSVKELGERARATKSEIEELETAIAAEEQDLGEIDESVSAAQQNLETLKGTSLWLRRKELKDRLHKAGGAAENRSQLEDEASRAEARARELEAEVAGLGLPSKSQVGEFRALERSLSIAEAKLDVAIGFQIEALRELEVEVGGDRAKLAVGDVQTYSATGELVVDLIGVAKMRLRGGSADAQAELDRAREQFDKLVTPAVTAANVASLDELERAQKAAAETIAEAQSAAARAKSLTEQLKALEDSAEDTSSLKTRLEDIEKLLEPYPQELLEEQSNAFGAAQFTAVEQAIAECEGVVSGAKDRRTELEKSAAANAANLKSLNETSAELAASLKTGAAALGEPWAELLESAARQTGELDQQLQRKNKELESLTSGEDSQLHEAKTNQSAAEAAYQKAKQLRDAHHKDHQDKKARVDKLAGEARVRQQAADSADYDTAKATVDKLLEERKQLPRPDGVHEVTDVERESAESRFTEAERSVRGARGDLRSAEGALEQVGGEVVRERRDGALAALNRFREEERNFEIEFNAWRLLLETLKQAERTQASHLGQSIIEPIAKRFSELTGSRYGELTLGPELEVGGIQASGAAREIEQLSVGTREQLSTVFRLSLAEQLESAVLLDDQLTQTDPKRMNWFKQRLREFAPKIQIIVLTCRPRDYLKDDEIPDAGESHDGDHVRAVNLEKVIERAA